MTAAGPATPSNAWASCRCSSASKPRPGCPAAGPRARPTAIEALSPGVTEDLVKLQERWEGYLDEHSILDFATIQHRFRLRQDAVVDHIDHVFVDEFQDTNPIQLAIHLHWLTRPETRLTVVGDDDQALYRFRGSDIACFTGLEANCLAAKVNYRREKLEQNWRSTKRIIEFAGAFRNATVLAQVSMDKKIRAPKSAPLGEPPRLLEGPWTSVCDHVAAEIDALGAGRVPDGGPSRPVGGGSVVLHLREGGPSRRHRRPRPAPGPRRSRTACLQPAQQDGRPPGKPRVLAWPRSCPT